MRSLSSIQRAGSPSRTRSSGKSVKVRGGYRGNSSSRNKTRATRNAINSAAAARTRAALHARFAGAAVRPAGRCSAPRGGAAVRPVGRRGPPAATTWKLCIPWKLFILTGGFISAGCKVSTLTAGHAPVARLLSGARSPMAPRLPSVNGIACHACEVSTLRNVSAKCGNSTIRGVPAKAVSAGARARRDGDSGRPGHRPGQPSSG
jgi:hypothetical protein